MVASVQLGLLTDDDRESSRCPLKPRPLEACRKVRRWRRTVRIVFGTTLRSCRASPTRSRLRRRLISRRAWRLTSTRYYVGNTGRSRWYRVYRVDFGVTSVPLCPTGRVFIVLWYFSAYLCICTDKINWFRSSWFVQYVFYSSTIKLRPIYVALETVVA